MQSWILPRVGGKLQTRAEQRKKSGQGWIGDARRLCSDSKEAGSHCYPIYYRALYYRNARAAYWSWPPFIANDFCRICGGEEEDETILHLLCTCPYPIGENAKLWYHNGPCVRRIERHHSRGRQRLEN